MYMFYQAPFILTLTLSHLRTGASNANVHIPYVPLTLLVNPDQPDYLSEDEDPEEDDEDDGMYTLRCTDVVTTREHADGYRLCQACRPSDAIIEDRNTKTVTVEMTLGASI